MKFRRRAKLFPGVYLNFSKSGISTTIGVKGASINIGKNGTYLNTGIPGTGLYDRVRLDGGKENRKNQFVPTPEVQFQLPPEFEIGAIRTDDAESTTTEGLQELQKTLLECYKERLELKDEIEKARTSHLIATILLYVSYVLIFGFFVKQIKSNKDDKKGYLVDLQKQLEDCFVNIDMDVEADIENKYGELVNGYKQLMTCMRIWDITSSVNVDRVATRSAASHSVKRKPVKFTFENIDIIKSKYQGLKFENANGGDIYIYPAFVAIVDSDKKFGLISINELDFKFQGQRFIEEEKVPSDAIVVDKTWAKVNKNGTPDKRFKDNYEIPVCQYGEVSLTSETGLNEVYSFSSYEKSKAFAQAMIDYKEVLN